jgi:flagellar hook-length control protein FliK
LLAQAIRQRGAAGDGASSQSLGTQGESDFLQGLNNSSDLDLFGGNRTAQATTAQATAETIAEALGQRIGASDAQNGGGTLRGGDQGGGFALVNSGVGARGPEPSVQSMPTLPDLTAAPEQQEFADQLLGRVRLLNQNGVQEAKLNLHPAELGRLSISITTDGDGARVAFAVDNPQAKEALEQAMPRLRELFQQSGLQLTDSSVAQQDGSRQSDQFAQGDGRGSFNTGNAADPREDILDIVPSSRSGPNHDGSLDTYA